jgi:hypothetical protein
MLWIGIGLVICGYFIGCGVESGCKIIASAMRDIARRR